MVPLSGHKGDIGKTPICWILVSKMCYLVSPAFGAKAVSASADGKNVSVIIFVT